MTDGTQRFDRSPRWRLPLTIVLLLALSLAVPTTIAQVVDLVVITPMAASETGGCYVGTTGTDGTIFLRMWPGFTGCDSFDGASDLCLTRLEFPGDQPNGTTISFGDSAQLRPSIAGDGSYAWFTTNLALCFIQSDLAGQEVCELPPGAYVHTATISPQGNRVGMVPRDWSDIQKSANVIEVRQASFPTYPLLEQYQFNNPLIYPETVDFMARTTWLVFDATDDRDGGGNWGLYVLNRATLELRTLAAPIPNYQLRNPTFAQTSDQVIAFDAVETATGRTTILTANIVTGDVREIALIDFTFGIPSFSADDSYIIYNRDDAAVFSTVSLRKRELAGDRITPVGVETPWISNAGYGAAYRRGPFDTTEVACPLAGPGGVGNTLTIQKNADPSKLDLSWGVSCSAVGSDYSIHEGALGTWYSHSSAACSSGGGTSYDGLSPDTGNRYFLIVPVSAEAEGGYGRDSTGAARPWSTTPCRPNQVESTCS